MKRRSFNKGLLGVLLAAGVGVDTKELLAAVKDPKDMRPQKGDVLVYANGEKEGELILAEHLQLEEKQLIAFPRDPDTEIVRDGSRFNKLMVIKLRPEELDEKTSANSAEGGVVAYSAICTHQGCDVNSWIAEKKHFFCYCHLSQFDPRKNGEVTTGPAQRRLPMVPIKIDKSGCLVVESPFTSKPGFKKRR